MITDHLPECPYSEPCPVGTKSLASAIYEDAIAVIRARGES